MPAPSATITKVQSASETNFIPRTSGRRSDVVTQRDLKHSSLDLLRAFAVMVVFLCHLLSLSPLQLSVSRSPSFQRFGVPTLLVGSRFGVLLFFVHTALVLMMSLERMHLDGGRHVTARFYVRRIFRIYPLSVACIGLVYAFSVPRWPEVAFVRPTIAAALDNLFLIQNLTNAPLASAPLWSLPFEVQMYAVLPLFYLAMFRFRIRPYWFWMVSVAIFFAPVPWIHINLPYFPCFLAGVLAFDSIEKRRKFLSWRWTLALFVILAFLYGSGSQYLDGLFRDNPRRLEQEKIVRDWIASLVVGMLIPLFAEISSRSVRKISATVAKYSYGIYLSHVPVVGQFEFSCS